MLEKSELSSWELIYKRSFIDKALGALGAVMPVFIAFISISALAYMLTVVLVYFGLFKFQEGQMFSLKDSKVNFLIGFLGACLLAYWSVKEVIGMIKDIKKRAYEGVLSKVEEFKQNGLRTSYKMLKISCGSEAWEMYAGSMKHKYKLSVGTKIRVLYGSGTRGITSLWVERYKTGKR